MRSFRPFAALLALALAACGAVAPEDEEDVIESEPALEAPLAKADAAGGNVELKVTVRRDQQAKASQAFKLTDGSASVRTVWFYDTRALDLYRSGLILRARKVKNGDDDSTAKLRPMRASDVARSWFSLDGFKCEEDRTGTASVQSCSFTALQDTGEIDDVAAGKRSIDKLFSADQERFVATYATKQPSWPTLRALGPIAAKVWKVKTSGFAPGLVAERWTLPDGTVILELSTRVTAAQAASTAAQLDAYLARKGLDTSAKQETKTKAALDYFVR